MQKCEGTPFRRREQSVHRPWGRMVSGVYSRNPGRASVAGAESRRLDEEETGPTSHQAFWAIVRTFNLRELGALN